jgi:carbamate kinase
MDAALEPAHPFPLDILGAETEGMIGYMIEQVLGNIIPPEDHIVTVLTQTEVDPSDPAFGHPTKPVGPVYDRKEAQRLCAEKGWSVAPDGDYLRRVVPSPRPQRIIEIDAIRMLVEHGVVVICAGGGGIPTAYDEEGKLHGVEAVIDKDLASGLLAKDLGAHRFVMLTDVPNVFEAFGTASQRSIRRAHPDALETLEFATGSMGPKVAAACEFARVTGNTSAIGQLSDLRRILQGDAGTIISAEQSGILYCD